MEDSQIALVDVLPEEWVEAVSELSARAGADGLCVKILFPPDVLVSAIGYRPQADAREIHISLRQQSPSDSSNDGIYVSLPRLEEGVYRKAESASGDDLFLLLGWWPCGIDLPVKAELQLATSREFLDFVTKTTRIQ
jgi:hypothetical protein